MAKDKAEKKPRNIKGAGERVVLQGVELHLWVVVKAIADERGLKCKNLEEAKRDKGLKAVIELLQKANPISDGEADADTLKAWVPIGTVKAETREEAILAVLGGEVPGNYRAPNLSAWLGGKRYKVPTQVSLEVESLD